MKLDQGLVLTALAGIACGYAIQTVEASTTSISQSIPTEPVLKKRYRDVIINPAYQKLQDAKNNGGATQEEEKPKPWVRTIYDGKVEIVTPTVVAGVTFSAEPPTTTNGLEPWISLDKKGAPKTIKPQNKNGNIKNKSPDYGTWFQTATTIRYTKEELKAHNMGEDEIFEQEKFIAEDLTYQSLNPILRCTPDMYKNKGLAKATSSEPFCFPRDNEVLYLDKDYFITWYYRFFPAEVKNVRMHLSWVKESAHQKGTKRDLDAAEKNKLFKRSRVIDAGGSLGEKSFFVSDWFPNNVGMFHLSIDQEWLGPKEFAKKVLISIQLDITPDDEYDHMANYLVVEFARGAKVAKNHQDDIKKTEEKQRLRAIHGDAYIEDGPDWEKYILIMTMPTCVLLAVFGMYMFVMINKKNTDLSFLRKVKLNKKGKSRKRGAETSYTELPQWSGPKTD